MRKNKMMRAASALLVATLLTTSVISGTFAKYTTSANGSDTARVAKWGVTVTANGDTFANSYNEKNAAKATVSSTDKVVAPGTEGSMVAMTLNGTPEVAVKVEYAGEFSLGTADNWKAGDNGEFYCPLVITVKSTNGTTEIKQNDTINNKTAFETAVNNAIKAYSKAYEAGTDLSAESQKNDSLTVSWKWEYENSNDAKDTILGNAAANGNAAEVTLKVTTTVTQVD